MRVTGQAAEILAPDDYRTPVWYEARRDGITASEIAAVLGLSPWVSAFDLWWEKRTGEQSQADNAAMRRGHRYEALILEDFAERHPEFAVRQPVGLVASDARPWQMCTPDALAYEARMAQWEWELLNKMSDIPQLRREDEPDPVAVVQAKSGARRDEWGDDGTDEIPVHYRAQVLWEMDTLGLNVAYVPVIFGFDYREYVVEYHEADIKLMREAAEAFLESLREDRMPEVDDSQATARRLKHLHPSIDPGEVEVPATVLRQYHTARRLRDAAEARMQLQQNRLRDLLGDHNIATVDGRKVASRSVYDVKERTQVVRAFTVNKLTIPPPKEKP